MFLILCLLFLPFMLSLHFPRALLSYNCSSSTTIDILISSSITFTLSPPSSNYTSLRIQDIPQDFTLILTNNNTIVELNVDYEIEQSFTMTVPSYQLASYLQYSFVEQSSTSISSSQNTCSIMINVLPCYSSCETCSEIGDNSDNKCTSCKEGYYSVEDLPNQCVDTDPSTNDKKYFLDDTNGMYLLCIEVRNDIYYKCLNCKASDLYFYNNQCISSSDKPSNTFISDSDYNKLDNCYSTCSECLAKGDDGYHNCVKCKEGYLYDNGNCYKQCNNGYGINKSNNTCIECGLINEFSFPKENICVCEIINGYYLDRDSNALLPCYENCETCTEKGNEVDNKCTKCLYNNTLLSDGNCKVENCPEYLYKDSNKCVNCKEINKYLYNGQCMNEDELPENTYIDNEEYNYVKNCYETCGQCRMKGDKDNNNCVTCVNELYMTSDSNCVKECPMYTVKEDMKCISCIDKGMFYYEGECVVKCNEGYLVNEINNICVVREEDKCEYVKCFNGGICNEGKCICDENRYSGDYCELVKSNDIIEIYQINSNRVKYSEINVFGFKGIDLDDVYSEYSITWSIDNLNEDDTLTGLNEKIIKIKGFKLKEKNIISVKITVSNITYQSSIEVMISLLNPDDFKLTLTYCGNYIIPFSTLLTLTVNSKKESSYSYIFKYENKYGDVIPMISDNDDYIGLYRGIIPHAKKICAEIKDSYNQHIDKCIDLTDKMKSNTEIEFNENLLSIYYSMKDRDINYIDNYLSYIVSNKRTSLSNKDMMTISSIIDTTINDISDYSIPQSCQIIKSLSNNSFLYTPNKEKTYKETIETLYTKILSAIDYNIISDNSILSLYSTVDIFVQNSFPNCKDFINTLNKEISTIISPGEYLSISTSTFTTNLFTLSSSIHSVSITQTDKTLSLFHSSSSSSLNSSCDLSSNSFCIDSSDYYHLKNELKYIKKNIEDTVFNVISLNVSSLNLSTSLYTYRALSESDTPIPISSLYFSTFIYNKNSVKLKYYKYSVSLPNDNKDIPLSKENAASSLCITLSSIKSATIACNTYFNYKTNRTICKCTGNAEITSVFSTTLSNYYKLLQFPTISLNQLNPFTLTFIGTATMLVISLSIASLYVDFKDDTNNINNHKHNYSTRHYLQTVFNSHINLYHSNIFSFTFYTTSYIYPFFGIFFLYHIDSPRYVRFFIEMFSTILSIVFSILPYYFSPFTYKELFINERDIEKVSWNIHSLPIKIIDIIYSCFYSFVSSMIMMILITFFAMLVKYKEVLAEIWSMKKKCIKLYTKRFVVIEYIKQKQEWAKIKSRIVAIYMFIRLYKSIMISKIAIEEEEDYMGCKVSSLISKGNDSTPTNRSYSTLNISTVSRRKILQCETSNEYVIVVPQVNDFMMNYRTCTIPDCKVIKNYKRIIIPHFYDDSIEISHTDNYTVFNVQANRFERLNLKKDRCGIIKTLFTSCCIIFLLGIVYYYVIAIFSNVYEKYEYYIIKIWLFPIIYDILIGRLISNCVIVFIKIMFIKFFYHKRKDNWIIKTTFQYLIPKYLIDMIKIRNMINKYYKYSTSINSL